MVDGLIVLEIGRGMCECGNSSEVCGGWGGDSGVAMSTAAASGGSRAAAGAGESDVPATARGNQHC